MFTKKAVPIFWFLATILCLPKSTAAQSYIADIQHISVEDGLSNRFVNSIYEDSQGFMWIATQHGLNRYDGYEFRLYTVENSDLTSNAISGIYEDSEQRLWLFSYSTISNAYKGNSIDILDLKTGRIQTFEHLFKDQAPFASDTVLYIYSDAEKNIWFSIWDGTVYQYKDKHFELLFSSEKQRDLKIFHIDNQSLWLYGKELLKINRQSKAVKKFHFQTPPRVAGMDQNNKLWLFQYHKNDFLKTISKKEGLQTFDLQNITLRKNIYSPYHFKKCYLNPANNLLWYGDASGCFFVFHPHEGMVVNLQDKIKPLLTYGQLRITDMYFDSRKRTWAATHDGIFIITLKKNKFTTLLSNKSEHYSSRGIVEDNQGIIYINTYGGRVEINPETGEIKTDKSKEGWLDAIKDKEGNLWFSDSEIEKYNPLSRQSQQYAYATGASPNRLWELWSIMHDKTGKVWIGSHKGLYYLNPETGNYREFVQYNDFPLLGKSTIYHLYEDTNSIWLSTSSGLYRLEAGKGITARYAREATKTAYIPYENLLYSYRDQAGVFWLGTRGGGLIRFEPKTTQYQQFTTKDGLSNNIIYAVYEDAYGKLWLPSNYGLMQFDKKSHWVNTWLPGDGIAHEEFNLTSHYQAADGRLYFGGLAGVTVFDPKDFTEEDSTSFPLRMTRCQVLDGETGETRDKTQAVTTSGALALSPSDKSFTIQFALLNYENVRQNKYAYKIEGLDKQWTDVQENKLRINALPYGNYVLRIKAQGARGWWSRHELSIPLSVNKPFYRKNSFILSSIVALLLIAYGSFHWRVRRLEKAKIRLEKTVEQRTQEIHRQKDEIEQDKEIIGQQAAKLQELDKVKSRFFANISHELRTPLTLILGYIGNILNKKQETISEETRSGLSISEQNARQLLTLTEEILDLSKLEAGQLKVREKPLAFYPFISRLCDAYRSFVNQKNIRFSLDFRLAQDIVLQVDENKFDKIINNLLSNATKFTNPGGSIQLEVTTVETAGQTKAVSCFQVKVSDTGGGIHPDDLPHIFERFYQSEQADAPSEGGTGIGLSLAKELAGLVNGDLSAESTPGKGSTFTFRFSAKTAASASATAPAKQMIQEEQQTVKKPKEKKEERTKPIVLLVEDHPEMRTFIKEILRPHYRISEATEGIEALEILQKQSIDLVVSDVMMPRLDGFGLLKRIREKAPWQEVPFMLLTARAADEDKLQAFDIGVDDYLTKPFQPPELLARMRNLIKNRQRRQEWVGKTEETQETQEKQGEPPAAFDREFVKRAEGLVKKELTNARFGIMDMAEALYVSERQLYRNMQRSTGLTPLKFIREIKLQCARTLLESKEKQSVSEVMHAVGIQSTGYFAKIYFKRFGKQPSEYF